MGRSWILDGLWLLREHELDTWHCWSLLVSCLGNTQDLPTQDAAADNWQGEPKIRPQSVKQKLRSNEVTRPVDPCRGQEWELQFLNCYPSKNRHTAYSTIEILDDDGDDDDDDGGKNISRLWTTVSSCILFQNSSAKCHAATLAQFCLLYNFDLPLVSDGVCAEPVLVQCCASLEIHIELYELNLSKVSLFLFQNQVLASTAHIRCLKLSKR